MKAKCGKLHCFLLLLATDFLLVNKACAQNDSIANPFMVSVKASYGFIIPHSESIRSISYSRPRGIAIDAGWLLLGQNAWNYCFCYPVSGISFLLTDFNNPEILGRSYSLMYFIEPGFSLQKKLHVSYRAALGISYLDTPYDPVSNPLNLFYSSTISFPLQVSFSANWKWDDRWTIKFSGHYNHISNGGIKEPNKGINFPTMSIGADYYFDTYLVPDRAIKKTELYPDFLQFYAMVAGTAKTVSHSEKQRYPVTGISLEARKRFARMNSWSAGAEWIADYSLRELNRRNGIKNEFHRAGLLAGHHLLIGRFTFYQKLGIYVYSPTKPKDPVYQRYGLAYAITGHWMAGIDLKAHRHIADFLDIRLGYFLIDRRAKKAKL